jgi:hypothetical protein
MNEVTRYNPRADDASLGDGPDEKYGVTYRNAGFPVSDRPEGVKAFVIDDPALFLPVLVGEVAGLRIPEHQERGHVTPPETGI